MRKYEKQKNSLFLPFLILAVCFNMVSCCDKPDNFKEKLTAYLEKDIPIVKVSSEKYAAYFDFSGVYLAYQDPQTAQTFNGLTQKVTANSSQFDTYKLANGEITDLSNSFSPAEQFKLLHDTKEQGQLYAPIEKTLKKITDEGRSAIFVTDFEEYTKEGVIYRQAYASPYFKKWLLSGGDITFFITNYKEGNLDKHLYYVVFDSNEHSLLSLVENALADLPKNYENFTLTTNAYGMSRSYLSEFKGGTFHDENDEDIITASIEDGGDYSFFMLEKLRAESYCFGAPWSDILVNANEQTAENGAQIPFTHLFRNIFIDLSCNDSYIINKMDVTVNDVQDDFDKYWGYFEATQNPPEKKVEGGEIYLDFSNHEVGEQYYDEKGDILVSFDYKKQPGNIIPVKDMLLFDDDLFNSSRQKNSSHTELGVYFDKRFNGIIPNIQDQNDLLRIDIIISDVTICDTEKINNLFAWQGNDCLSASIKDVLQDLKPIGKPVYSYFVRII